MNPTVRTHANNIVAIMKSPIVIDGTITAHSVPFNDFFLLSNTKTHDFSNYSCSVHNFEMVIDIVEEIANIIESPFFDRTSKEQEFLDDPTYNEIDFEKPIYLHYWKVIKVDD